MATLVKIVEVINQSSIPGTVWIEGGLLTEALNPTDFSITLVLTQDVYNKISRATARVVPVVPDDLDVREVPLSQLWRHRRCGAPDGEIMHRYWLRQFGFDREERAKGVIEMLVPWLGQ